MGDLPSKLPKRSSSPSLEISSSVDNAGSVSVALCNFPGNGTAANRISMSDKLTVMSDLGDTLRVKVASSGTECYMPRNIVAKVLNRWLYVGISREQAEELLQSPQNQTGTFMIRESQMSKGTYSLSVLQRLGAACSVKHYRIHRLHDGRFYLFTSHAFSSLSQLVDHYSDSIDGLCCLLRQPCFIREAEKTPAARVPPSACVRKPTINWRNVDR
uniref:SH2 domain-containing protein n=1 Tax=Denticeps clupeoides TaxID=299321 RepID=A0AAY4D1M0_9TELE